VTGPILDRSTRSCRRPYVDFRSAEPPCLTRVPTPSPRPTSNRDGQTHRGDHGDDRGDHQPTSDAGGGARYRGSSYDHRIAGQRAEPAPSRSRQRARSWHAREGSAQLRQASPTSGHGRYAPREPAAIGCSFPPPGLQDCSEVDQDPAPPSGTKAEPKRRGSDRSTAGPLDTPDHAIGRTAPRRLCLGCGMFSLMLQRAEARSRCKSDFWSDLECGASARG
jgi:hypothetical protein